MPAAPPDFDFGDAAATAAAVTGFVVNHFGMQGMLASPGTKRGDMIPAWRERYFVLAISGNFLVYYLSAAEATPRGVMSLVGGAVEATEEQDGCGIKLSPLAGISVQIALPTAVARDTWLAALQAASQRTFVDSRANRELLSWLNTPGMRVRTVLYAQSLAKKQVAASAQTFGRRALSVRGR